MGVELRKYQREAVDAIEREWHEGRSNTLLVQATGTGKTVVFGQVARNAVDSGYRVLVLAHREELLNQAADKLGGMYGLECGLEMATSHDNGAPVLLGSVQTIGRENRLATFAPDEFGAIIVDEAHHTLADSYMRIINHFKLAYLLGVTATPDRGDKKALAKVYDSIAYEYGLAQAVNDGYLCRIIAKTVPLEIDARSLRESHGDYTLGSAGNVVSSYLDDIADAIAREAADRHVVVFLPLVQIAKDMADALKARGMCAEEIDGESEDRAAILGRFERGETQVLCNAMLLTEGWDCPICDCVVVLRPTKVRALYAQMVGRGTRPCPGKENLLLLDFLWMTGEHRLCAPASLVAKDEDQQRRMSHVDGDIMETQEQVERDILAEREAALAEKLEKMRRAKKKLVDVVQYELSIGNESLANYEPSFAWEFLEPTEKQVQYLEKMGIDANGMTRGKAVALIDVMMNRQNAGMATPKQVRCLEKYGFVHPGMWSFEEAQKMIGRLAGANWKPWQAGINPKNYVPEFLRG